MKRILQRSIVVTLLALSFNLFAQEPAPPASSPPPAQPVPAPTPAPAPSAAPSAVPAAAAPTEQSAQPSSGTKDIPVISIGDQIKPMANDKKEKPLPKDKNEKDVTTDGTNPPVKKQAKRTPVAPKTVTKVDLNVPLFLESKQLVHSRLSQIGDEVVFIVAENYPAKGTPLLPKGSLVVGKISAMERMQKDQPAGIRVNMDAVFTPAGSAVPLSGTLEVVRQKGQDNFGGKEVFIPVGLRQSATLNKKFSARVAPKPSKIKAPKGLLSAPAQIEDGVITIKLADLKYPTRLEVLIEAPQGMEVTNLKEDSIKIVRVNDFVLPRIVTPLDDKIKVADRNKNNVKDIGYKFPGWDLIRYLPEGSSTVVLSGLTKDGKPVEFIATVKTEYK